MGTLRALLPGGGDDESACDCEPSVTEGRLVIDADACAGGGKLATSDACRATAVAELARQDVEQVCSRADGVERVYDDGGAALLLAAGHFVDRARVHDERLAELACRNPLWAAREATGRAGPVARIAAETGLAELASRVEGYSEGLSPSLGPTISRWRVSSAVPDAPLRTVRDLETGATARIYGGDGEWLYHLTPVESTLDATATTALAAAATHLASREFDGRAPHRAVREVSGDDVPVETVAGVLAKHADGYGLLEDLFADPALSDAYVTAPVAENPVRVVVDGESMPTNLRLARRGADALASRFRRESGRAFSRAAPTLDATATVADRRTRVAGLRPPASDGLAFAFRAHDRDHWRLSALVENGTLPPSAAALLSLAVERGRSILVAGSRGAGKTTLLGASLWELRSSVRTVVIEDTPELPVRALQDADRDVQPVQTGTSGGEIPPAAALRTALRLGDGALVVGEVRGEEAQVLYEAMRVGANSEAVLGTIHGDGASDVFDRVVEDLGVSPTAFAVTDLVVTCEATDDGERRVRCIEEVTDGQEVGFATLFEHDGDGPKMTGRIQRGNSRLVSALAGPEDSYNDALGSLGERRERFSQHRLGSGETAAESPRWRQT